MMTAKTVSPSAPARILRCRQVLDRVGVSKATLYAKLRLNPARPSSFDPSFPRPLKIGAKATGWLESEIEAWIAAQARTARHYTDDESAR
jgi:prophage regulatory protein